MSTPPPGRLREAFLDEVHFRRTRDFTWAHQLSFDLEAETSAEIGATRTEAVARLAAEVRWSSPQGGVVEAPEVPFEIRATVGGIFDWDRPDRSDEDIIGWLEFNATHLLWPYLRTYVAMVTVASGLPPLTIQTISVPSLNLGPMEEPSIEEAVEGSEHPRGAPAAG